MKEMHKLKKLVRKHRNEESSSWRKYMSKLFVKLKLENRPWVFSLLVLAGILLAGLTVSTLFAVPPTTFPTALGYPDGTSCFQDSDCASLSCNLGVGGSRFCASGSNCVRKEGTIVNTYPSTGPFQTDTIDADDAGYRCDSGFWSEDPFASTHTFSRISFTEPGSDASTSLVIPKNSYVREASLYVYGLPTYQVTLEDDFERAAVIGGYSVRAKQVDGESKIVLMDVKGAPLGTYKYSGSIDWAANDFSITTASIDGKTKIILAARSQDSFAIYSIGKYQISNPSVDIGMNGANWQYSGRFTPSSGPQEIDFSADLAKLLASCTPTEGLCTIPIQVSSESPGTIVLSNLKVVLNSAPKLSSVVLDPPVASYGEPITCVASATDADGDHVSYRYKWLRNGVQIDTFSNILSPEKVQRGDLWQCIATPVDPYSEGTEVSSRELHVSGLPDYSTCSGAHQCESKYCVSGVCCFTDPCPGDGVCSPGEDGTSDSECCIPGDGVCTGGCSGLDIDCSNPWSSTDLKEKGARITVHTMRNDKSLLIQVVGKDGAPISRAPLEVSLPTEKITLYSNPDGYVAVPVDWGDRISLVIVTGGITIDVEDLVVRKKADVEMYSSLDLEKMGFANAAEISEIGWTHGELEAKDLNIEFYEKVLPGKAVTVAITDRAGNPVEGVPVTLETTQGLVTVVTNNLGLASIQEYAGDPLAVRIEKDGYVIATEEVAIVSTSISYWAMIPILILIVPLIIFFVFSTARGRLTGFGVKKAPVAMERAAPSSVPKGMSTAAYAKRINTLRQSPITAQILKHVEMSLALIAQRDYSGAQQEITLSQSLYSKVKSGLKGDEERIISAKLSTAKEQVDAAYKKQIELLKHAPAAQRILDHIKFIDSRITEVSKIELDIRKSINTQIKSLVTPAFLKKHPKEAEQILDEIDESAKSEVYDALKGLKEHLNRLKNNLIEAKSDKVLLTEGMSDAEVNRTISARKRELQAKAQQIIEHFKLKIKSI